jgi:hypothetical protein
MSSITIIEKTLSALAMGLEKKAYMKFKKDPLTYGLCCKNSCLCLSEVCIGATAKSYSLDLAVALDDTIRHVSLETTADVSKCIAQMEGLFDSFTTPNLSQSCLLVLQLKEAGLEVENPLTLSRLQVEELVCKFFDLDRKKEYSFDTYAVGGTTVEFGYHPEAGLYGWDGYPLT